MKWKVILFVSCLSIASSPPAGPARAQEARTEVRPAEAGASLESLVAEALAKNPELNFYRAEIAAAKGERRQAGAWPNPELSGDVGRKRASGSGLAAEGTAWSVSVTQPFEYPGRLALRKAIANRQVALAELGLSQFHAALAARVRTLGFQLFISQQKAQAANEVARRGQELVEVLIQRDPAGVTPLLETRIIEANVINLRRQAIDAAKEAQRVLFELNQLRGEPLSAPLQISDPKVTFPELPRLEDLIRVASTNNFELRMRQVELEQQGFRISLAKNERWPTVSVGPFYSQERAGEKEQVVGVGVSVPLPLWNRNSGNIDAAKARKQQAETTLALAQRQVERDLREKFLAYQVQLEEIQRWRTNIVDELRSAGELADRHYRLGSLPVSTYVEVQEQYLEALDSIFQTQVDALEALQQLEIIAGEPLKTPSVKREANFSSENHSEKETRP